MIKKCHYFLTVFVLLFLTLATHSHGVKNEGTVHEIDPLPNQNSAGETVTVDRQFCESDSCRGHGGVQGETSRRMTARRADREDEMARGMEEDGWDKRGYVTFCPCMGNFGNQMEQYIGSIAFAKALNRTLILPPFQHVSYRDRRVHLRVPFTDLFQVGPLQEFHRAVAMQDFLERLAPKYWPPGQRKGYSFTFAGRECSMKQSAGYYWKNLSPAVVFDECVLHKLTTHADISEERSLVSAKNAWNERFPPDEHPVLALSQAPGKFPILSGNRQIQKYIRWTEESFAEARTYIAETFGNESWMAVHLRNGEDWVKACERDIETRAFVMASPQCHDMRPGAVAKDMCLPSLSHILELTLKVFQDVQAKHLFIATDKHPYLQDFGTLLDPLGVAVHYLDPGTPQVDLMILGQADYFIGSCASSFTSFVKRERDANNRPSIFWGQEYKGFQ